MASWLLLQRGDRGIPKGWPSFILIGSLVIGGLATFVAYGLEFHELPNRLHNVPTIEWIRGHVPVGDPMCSDPARAELLGAFTGRQIFPSNSAVILRELSTTGLRKNQAYTSGFGVVGSGDAEYIRYLNYFSRSIICQQFPTQVRFLKMIGVSDAHIDDITGCPRDFMRQMDQATAIMIHQPAVDVPAFQALCPWVITSSETKGFWRLPSGYTETPIDGTMSVWRVTP
jgi:hypothetical protein